MYLTLPSNTLDVTETNKTNSYRVQLPEPVSLDGRWEVALVDIQYPFSWRNVFGSRTIAVRYGTKKDKNAWLLGEIPEGYYGDVGSLIGGIKLGIRDAARKIGMIEASSDLHSFRLWLLKKYFLSSELIWHERAMLPELDDQVSAKERERDQQLYDKYSEERDTFNLVRHEEAPVSEMEQHFSHSFSRDTSRLQLHLALGKSINGIRFPESIKYMLGLEGSFIKGGITYPRYSPDLTGGLTTLFVHCNIVEPQVVGNCKSELLRTVPVNSTKRFGDTVYELFISPHYVNVLHKHFDHIRIEIRTDNGEPLPFEFGKVICKLHFRKSKGL